MRTRFLFIAVILAGCTGEIHPSEGTLVLDSGRPGAVFTMACTGPGRYADVNTLRLTQSMGLAMPRSGCVTKALFTMTDGTQYVSTFAFSAEGSTRFRMGEMLFASAGPLGIGTNSLVKAGGQAIASTPPGSAGAYLLVIEVQFDF